VIDWVIADELIDLLEPWLLIGRGKRACVDALIRLLGQLPMIDQISRGVTWVANLCIQDGRVTVKQSCTSNEWLKEIRPAAEEHGRLAEWQKLVDSLVVAGNEDLAPYSR
jgi:hypothetical protein